jgi:hypothetical protein
MQDAWFRFVLTLLATWRVTHLLAYEDGPWDVVVRLRAALGNRALGRLFDCFQCVSMWVAAAFGLFVSRGPLEWGVVWLALSGGACLLERLGRDSVVIQRLETKGDDDALLRRQAGGDAATEERPAEPGSHEFEAGPLRAVR